MTTGHSTRMIADVKQPIFGFVDDERLVEYDLGVVLSQPAKAFQMDDSNVGRLGDVQLLRKRTLSLTLLTFDQIGH